MVPLVPGGLDKRPCLVTVRAPYRQAPKVGHWQARDPGYHIMIFLDLAYR
jgi:hypothetical protein